MPRARAVCDLTCTMEKEVLKALTGFFECLERVDEKWRQIIRDVERPLCALKNQCEQLRHVCSEKVDNAEICRIGLAREKLIHKIALGIHEEEVRIKDAIVNLGNYKQEIKDKLKNWENIMSEEIWDESTLEEIINGTPSRPGLEVLLRFSLDACEYYQQSYMEINEAFKAINPEDEKTVSNLIEKFEENQQKRAIIDKTLAYTQFIIK